MIKANSTRPVYFEPFDLYLFGEGKHWDLYKLLGAHPCEQDGLKGYRFAVWAPNARAVHLTGEFNNWNHAELPLYPVGSSGIWAAFLPNIKKSQLYKFSITDQAGNVNYKADPYALFAELRPGVSGITWDLDNYKWNDQNWLNQREKNGIQLNKPISIYEVHAGSWRRPKQGLHPFLSFKELAHSLIPYVKDLGFTHIEFLPLAEHPLDQSWGYQTGHYFAPSSRFGTPEDLKEFIDLCHQNELGVLLDWVPAHFPKDSWGLGRFDGTALYEHLDPKKGEHPDWGTYIFNYGRNEVKNFLLSNALYWLKEFHIDGLRIDAVASMLYLDYSRKENEWIPNKYGGRENLEAIDFIRELNTAIHQEHPGAVTMAEESTDWAGVSRPTYTGGLGFTYKWNMGWMHDSLKYMQLDPIYRSHNHNSLTFSMLYAFSENFLLPLSHDEVVHGKGALLSKMPGDIWQKQANLRLLYAYMWAHPGKKLLFMGSELGQWNEWNSEGELDWVLFDFKSHRGFHTLIKDLNAVLRSEPAMYQHDYDWSGFSWMDFSDHNNSIYSFSRNTNNAKPLLWVFNFTPIVRYNYHVNCPHGGRWQEIFNSDHERYDGSNVTNPNPINAFDYYAGHRIALTLPPLGAVCLVPID
ncbi:1,4-alpha-glucan branching protein GlgB [Desulfovibrio litoralis]|uniref:1,4-alpha-glucan branching enzyme GlgB n=1 Tax=Desulfovibrio litoralis DSM 11393 TaxID=1121455 RepID=A0A1M7SP94_9BACT|nr:1,4-alpha-glucan branching protein GlgB [Desulfovibrio litoralis]SHN60248.1 1,4-alpha-glucan branching enzyme [Desulfovibrio litoralis DSM 11393]